MSIRKEQQALILFDEDYPQHCSQGWGVMYGFRAGFLTSVGYLSRTWWEEQRLSAEPSKS